MMARKKNDDDFLPDWLLWGLVVLIAVAWFTSFVVSAINPAYNPPAEINTAFITIIGGILLNAAARRRGANDDDKDDDKPGKHAAVESNSEGSE